MKAADQRINRFERSQGGIRKLLQQGMKLLADVPQAQRATRADLRELAASQKITDRRLQTLIASLQKGANGRRRS